MGGRVLRRLVVVATLVVAAGVLASPAGASDRVTARKLVVTAADLGGGYTSSPAEPKPDIFKALALCVGRSIDKRKLSTTLDGLEFTNTAGTAFVSSSVDLVKTVAMARADRAVIADVKFPSCLAEVDKELSASQGVSSVQAERVTVQKFGQYSTAILAHASGTSGTGQQIDVTEVTVAVIRGRAELTASFTTTGTTPFSESEAEAIVTKVDQRLAKASVT
jgi:hypothetical protein